MIILPVLLSDETSLFLHASYEDMLTKCLTGVKVLLVKCQEYINQAVPLKTLPSARAIEGTDQQTGQTVNNLKQVSGFLW